MKGYSLQAVNDLRYEELEYPECATGWCVVKVKAAGICSSDIPRVYTKGTYHFPTIPGHEFSGVVDKVADIDYDDVDFSEPEDEETFRRQNEKCRSEARASATESDS